MMDGVFALNEIIDFASRNKRERLLVKVDFPITYDCVSWKYFRYLMRRMHFEGDGSSGWIC